VKLPAAIAFVTEGLPMEQVTVGRSVARVWRVGDQFYLKVASRGDELAAEMARLNWFAGRVPVPKVIAFERGATETYLLTSALEGVAAHEAASREDCVGAVGAALCRLHRLDIAACPFDACLAVTIERARANALAGFVDESDFDASRSGRSALELLADVEATRPADEDLVVTHGDYCLPNVILSTDGDWVGFVDLGRAGVADRYQDLALAARSIAKNFGDAYVAAFFATYGIEPDPLRIAFYQLLDEFF
jgi:aminoglycoside 3'-phosphotransferase II